MFRTAALRRFAYFCQPDWPGGIYATPTVTGSRNGAIIVGCWAALMYFLWTLFVFFVNVKAWKKV
jgi:sphinganine-1-phosphate aldolase